MTANTATVSTGAAQTKRDPHHRARVRLRFMFLLYIIGGLLAAAWDGWWHVNYTFDGFWSPPHVLAYTLILGLSLMSADLVFRESLRAQFGPALPMPLMPYKVPGALILLNGAIVILGIGGVIFDNIWHSAFGINETAWSFPHAIIGWGLLLITLGFMSCRMQLGELPVWWLLVLAYFVFVMLMGAALGPIGRYQTPDAVRVEAQIPAYLAQPEVQDLFRIVLENNLTRTSPALLMLAPLGAAAGAAFVRSMHRRPWLLLLVALLVSGSSDRSLIERAPALLQNPANTAALPVFTLALAYTALRWLRVGERLAWFLAGTAFALSLIPLYDLSEAAWGLGVVGGALAVVGAGAGRWIYGTVAAPFTWRQLLPLLLAAAVFPAITGVVDLYFRLKP